jgi:hypothetical protein
MHELNCLMNCALFTLGLFAFQRAEAFSQSQPIALQRSRPSVSAVAMLTTRAKLKDAQAELAAERAKLMRLEKEAADLEAEIAATPALRLSLPSFALPRAPILLGSSTSSPAFDLTAYALALPLVLAAFKVSAEAGKLEREYQQRKAAREAAASQGLLGPLAPVGWTGAAAGLSLAALCALAYMLAKTAGAL